MVYTHSKYIIFLNYEAGEMAQKLKALAAFGDDLVSVPNSYMAAYNHL